MDLLPVQRSAKQARKCHFPDYWIRCRLTLVWTDIYGLSASVSGSANVEHQSPWRRRSWNQPHGLQNHRHVAPPFLTSLYRRQEMTGEQQNVLGPFIQNRVRKDDINISAQTHCNLALARNGEKRLFTADTLYRRCVSI